MSVYDRSIEQVQGIPCVTGNVTDVYDGVLGNICWTILAT